MSIDISMTTTIDIKHIAKYDSNKTSDCDYESDPEMEDYYSNIGEIKYDQYTCAEAASYGDLDTLKKAQEQKCTWYEDTCSMAAAGGHFECLKYAHENGCPWDEDTCYMAAAGGHFECLKYAHGNGCTWDYTVIPDRAYTGNNIDCIIYVHENGGGICDMLCSNKNISILSYGMKNGCRCDEFVTSYAADNGNLNCLKYLHENGCPWDSRTTLLSFYSGNIDCLKYAVENGCPWHPYSYKPKQMLPRNLECLVYSHENGRPFKLHEYIYTTASYNDSLPKEFKNNNGIYSVAWFGDTNFRSILMIYTKKYITLFYPPPNSSVRKLA
jgi:hypothetical protein